MYEQEKIIGICQKTNKAVLMIFDEEESSWLCLHKDTRKKELKEIENFLKKHN